MARQIEVIAGLRERYPNIVVEDKGDVFNSDLTQAIELGYLLDVAACMLQAGIARKESRGAHSRRDYPTRSDENFLKRSISRWRNGGPDLTYKEVRMTKWDARGGSTKCCLRPRSTPSGGCKRRHASFSRVRTFQVRTLPASNLACFRSPADADRERRQH